MKFINYLRSLASIKTGASILLFVAAIVAVITANTAFAHHYIAFLDKPLSIEVGSFNLLSHGGEKLSLLQFVNDGLMTLFFFVVGLEIKREVLVGELSSLRQALLPVIAAFGGMILPVVVYNLLCPTTHPGSAGMAIPMATDIAFSLAVLSLLGKRVPLSLKVFLTAFAVVDDIGGIIIIALFYSSHFAPVYLLASLPLFAVVYLLGRWGRLNGVWVWFLGTIIWYLFLQSGVHSTISGVLLAFMIPARPRLDAGKYIQRIQDSIADFEDFNKSCPIILSNAQIEKLKRIESASDHVISPLQNMEDHLHGFVSYFVLPFFAFVNAGVMFTAEGDVLGRVAPAVALGLLLGKLFGVFGFTWLAVKLRLSYLPIGMNWKNLFALSMLGGIGFTVSLFLAQLSFGSSEPLLLNQAKIGVFTGSILSGILGYIMLRLTLKAPKA